MEHISWLCNNMLSSLFLLWSTLEIGWNFYMVQEASCENQHLNVLFPASIFLALCDSLVVAFLLLFWNMPVLFLALYYQKSLTMAGIWYWCHSPCKWLLAWIPAEKAFQIEYCAMANFELRCATKLMFFIALTSDRSQKNCFSKLWLIILLWTIFVSIYQMFPTAG